MAGMITETEAYDGSEDKACHARAGKTKRNAPMFDEAGTIYVYFTYGMHWMLNLVTGEKDYPAAVLVRAVQLTHGVHPSVYSNILQKYRKKKNLSFAATPLTSLAPQHVAKHNKIPLLVDGPAKLTKAFGIDKKLTGYPLGKKTGLWVEDRGVIISGKDIKRTPRIGVSSAGAWAKKPYRFVLESKR